MKQHFCKWIGTFLLSILLCAAYPLIAMAQEEIGGQVNSKGTINFAPSKKTEENPKELTKTKLPQTGESQWSFLTFGSGSLLVLISVNLLFKKRKEGED